MTQIKTVLEKVEFLCSKEDCTHAKLGLSIGRGSAYVKDVFEGKREMTMEEFLKICDFFCLLPEEFFADIPKTKEKQTCKKLVKRIKQLPFSDLCLVDEFLDDLQ